MDQNKESPKIRPEVVKMLEHYQRDLTLLTKKYFNDFREHKPNPRELASFGYTNLISARELFANLCPTPEQAMIAFIEAATKVSGANVILESCPGCPNCEKDVNDGKQCH